MNKSFLDLCAQDILAKHANHFTTTTIVFPSKRAMSVFQMSLGKFIDKPIFMPQRTTIQDFCLSRQNATIPDSFLLLFYLYDAYRTIQQRDIQESFEEFYPWGEMLLSDFNDIDKYLIDAKALYRNIADIKDIDNEFNFLEPSQRALVQQFWDITKIDNQNSDSARQKFIDFWNKLYAVYQSFNTKLDDLHLSYEGKAIRSVSEAGIEEQDKIFGDRTYIFIGFNALSTSESKIFNFLQKRKQAFFYWDYDTYYKKNENHEAGIFIRKNIESFPNELAESEFSNFENDKNINIINVPNAIAEAKWFGEYFNNLKDNNKTIDQTAIVLADEKMIDPLMRSIPDTIKYNITLGYPIRSSAAYTFFESILDLCQNKSGDKWYFKDVLRICENPLIPKNLQEDAKKLRCYITSDKHISLSAEECLEKCNLDYIWNLDTTIENYVQNLISCIQEIAKNQWITEIDKTILFTIYKELQAFNNLVSAGSIQLSTIKFINALLKKSLQGQNIAIQGNKEENLQILGILETRLLDFKNIIITSLTDNNLPKTSAGGSFIPYSLRTGFGMPTIKEQSAMYSYYFYRLLQRSENITILYYDFDNGKKCEKSRFIMQLLYESPFKILLEKETSQPTYKILNGITIEKRGFDILMGKNVTSNTISKKERDVQNYFAQLKDSNSKKKLTPTSITNYLQCPLKFYFANIKKLREPQELDEIPQQNELGNYLHYAMHTLYDDLSKKHPVITSEVLEQLQQDSETITNAIEQAMSDNHATAKVKDPNSTEMIITLQTIQNILQLDKKCNFSIEGLEKNDEQITISNVKVGGIIDRLDYDTIHKVYRVIDYKTGTCKNIDDKLSFSDENIFQDKSQYDKMRKEAFQACLYSYILKENHPGNTYQPHLYFTQTFFAKDNNEEIQTSLTYNNQEITAFDKSSNEELYNLFEKKLKEIIDELLNEEIPFQMTTNTKKCEYCSFNRFCSTGTLEEDD